MKKFYTVVALKTRYEYGEDCSFIKGENVTFNIDNIVSIKPLRNDSDHVKVTLVSDSFLIDNNTIAKIIADHEAQKHSCGCV